MKNPKKLFQRSKETHIGRMGILVFCNVALVGVGFCSFVSATSTLSIQMDLEAADVNNASLFRVSEIGTFAIGPDGIVEDQTIKKSVTFDAKFLIYNASISDYLIDGVLNFKTRLEFSDLTFLKTYVVANPTCTGAALTSSVVVDAEKSLVTTLSYTPTSTSGSSEVTIQYKVQDEESETIKKYFSNRPTFNFRVGLV